MRLCPCGGSNEYCDFCGGIGILKAAEVPRAPEPGVPYVGSHTSRAGPARVAELPRPARNEPLAKNHPTARKAKVHSNPHSQPRPKQSAPVTGNCPKCGFALDRFRSHKKYCRVLAEKRAAAEKTQRERLSAAMAPRVVTSRATEQPRVCALCSKLSGHRVLHAGACPQKIVAVPLKRNVAAASSERVGGNRLRCRRCGAEVKAHRHARHEAIHCPKLKKDVFDLGPGRLVYGGAFDSSRRRH